jgi:hypothetical protein
MLAAPTVVLSATTVALDPVADAYVTPDVPDANFGGHTAWIMNRQFAQAYLRFDLSSLPANAVITSASLNALACEQGSPARFRGQGGPTPGRETGRASR